MTTDNAALRELRAAATSGPWGLEPDEGGVTEVVMATSLSAYVPILTADDADAALIVAAVNALPDLLDERDRMLATIARVEALAAEWECEPASDRMDDMVHVRFCPDCSRAAALRAALAGEDA